MESPWLNPQKYFSHLVAIGNIKIKRGKQNIPHIEALEKAKPHPHFQKLLPASKKKKPLSRRGNHALIVAKS